MIQRHYPANVTEYTYIYCGEGGDSPLTVVSRTGRFISIYTQILAVAFNFLMSVLNVLTLCTLHVCPSSLL